jgi:hypothetical protein
MTKRMIVFYLNQTLVERMRSMRACFGRMLKKAESRASSSFDKTSSWFETAFGLLTMRRENGSALMVSLSNHELVAVRQAHREAMGRIVFQQPVSLAEQT